uniref:DUF6570 domain-containing protein n=1 Tax=Magallana gigas TaxID=29159 RepID=A0A8W8NCK4_MAGGI
MPTQCQAKNLLLDSIPEELKKLCDLECQLISKRIPFMKIVNLPRAAQKGIKGAVVNVPTDLSKIKSRKWTLKQKVFRLREIQSLLCVILTSCSKSVSLLNSYRYRFIGNLSGMKNSRIMESKAYKFEKDKINEGRNIKGQPKREKPRSGVAGTEFIGDSEKRKQTLYQRKKTLFNKDESTGMNIHEHLIDTI